ncbi:MAG: hypothetical protein JXA20_11845 [Spirochaetes bacterium]|nr:hypothetical protein [Spirochaetota bacterium]
MSKLFNASPIVSDGLQRYHRDVTRYDSDTSISYAVTDWFSLLAGFKLQGYSYSDYIFLVANPVRSEYNMMNYGPALGFGVTLHVFEGLYFLCNLNGVFMFGSDDAKFQYAIAFLFPNRGSFYSYGGTAQGSLAYIFSSINTTVSLGFRYQMLYCHQRDVAFLEFGGKYDSIYGVTLSAVYTFHLTR